MRHDRGTIDGARTINCPYCARRYRLPESLIGSGGARIRCPGCAGVFVLRIEGAAAIESSARDLDRSATHFDSAPAERPRSELDRLADQAVATLDIETAAQLADAHTRGRLFAEFGPRLLEAFDGYRRLAGSLADPAPFRQALSRRCGVEFLDEASTEVHS